ncbi:ABC transporter family substrate-binding protein [Kutzneria albida]|uniref:Solute-binding protein family 5 domain-containing protein n=1 Tax=Kutzneria albida DSM 43870 TaxID=1449976 RepID=W5W8C7_9PSEU|nr:ABC transporter family substrate-binding protein [Kutzneria albida]AHH94484.1 hypothetical protein KALB_1111 [Kutzneria albida DSM 43870]
MSRGRAAVAAVLVCALGLTGCAGGPQTRLRDPNQQVIGQNDINRTQSDLIAEDGQFQWPLDAMPDNWNYNQVDGSSLDTYSIVNALEPTLFSGNADGTVTLNRDYLVSAEVVAADPQVVVYRINPKARWSNGRELSWQDFQAQARALSGRAPGYLVGSTVGYDRISKVEPGTEDHSVRVTFSSRFAEWRGLFAPLYPKELNADPGTFNKGWLNGAPISAGPFRLDTVDGTARTARLVRDEHWWGREAHLASILFKVVDRAARADALASGAIDFYDTNGSVDLVQRARSIPGVVLRQALTPDTYHLTTNAAPGRPLSDQRVRLAVLKAVDRAAITKAETGQLSPEVKPAGNHLFPQGSTNYADHSGQVPFDPEQARRDLEAAGWTPTGDQRTKDGKPLVLDFVVPSGTPSSRDIATLVQQQLATVGVKVVVRTVPTGEFGARYLNVGNFDLTAFRWLQTPYPLSSNAGEYRLNLNDPKDLQQNYGRVGSKEINDLYDSALGELDEAKRIELAQHIDCKLWAIGGEVTLYQLPGAVAVRASVANFGAFGFAQFPIDYTSIGFLK